MRRRVAARARPRRVLQRVIRSAELEVFAEHEQRGLVFVVRVAVLRSRIAVSALFRMLIEQRALLTRKAQPVFLGLLTKMRVLRKFHGSIF
jgi:hypothetical protein